MRRWRSVRAGIALALLLSAGCAGTAIAPEMESPTAAARLPTPTAQPQPSPTPVEGVVTLAAVGDVMLGRSIAEGIAAEGALFPFEHVVEILQAADIGFANLESPLTEGGTAADKGFVFRGPPLAARGLAQAGIDVVSLANNHAMDYGPVGLTDTIAALADAGVAYTGAGESEAKARTAAVITANGLRVAFLAYTNTPVESDGWEPAKVAAAGGRGGPAWATQEVIAGDVEVAKKQADVVVVSMHTGLEYRDEASPLQASLARAAVDAGAKLVLGHSAHVLQGLETYNGGLIMYGLGNFVFDFDRVDYSVEGLPSAMSAIVEVELTAGGVVSCRITPMQIEELDGRPRIAVGDEAARIMGRLRGLSDGSCGPGG